MGDYKMIESYKNFPSKKNNMLVRANQLRVMRKYESEIFSIGC